MKLLLAALLICSATSAFAQDASAPAPCQEEAQFIGKVRSHRPEAADQSMCSFKIDFSMYNESMVCPLNSGESSDTTFYDSGCSLKDGDQVSGYLVKKWGVVLWEGH